MRKLIFLLLLPLSSFAQINYGVLAGYSRVGGYDAYQYKGSGIGGIFLRYTKNHAFASIEANYIGRGGKAKVPFTDPQNNKIGDGQKLLNTSYLQIPLFVGGSIKARSNNVFLKAGPYYSFLLNSKFVTIPPYGTSTYRTTINGSGFYNDFGLIASLGIELKTLLFFEARIERGLTNVHSRIYGRNTAISLIIGLKFGKQ